MAYYSADRRTSVIPGLMQINTSRGVEYPLAVTNQPVNTPGMKTVTVPALPVIPASGLGGGGRWSGSLGCGDMGCNVPVKGLGIDFGIDVGQIASSVGNQVVNSVWPNIEGKINELAPQLVNKAVDQVKARVPEFANQVLRSPEVQKEAATVVAKYEDDYKKKYRPLIYFVFIAGSLWTAAAAVALYDRFGKKR